LSLFGLWDRRGDFHHPHEGKPRYRSRTWQPEIFREPLPEYEYEPRPEVRRYQYYDITPGPRPFIEPVEPEVVEARNNERPGTVIILTKKKVLLFTLNRHEAYMYPIAVGRQGFQWTGIEKVSRIVEWPAWYPPEEMRVRQPGLPEKMEGGIKNPLGAVAIYLGNTLYRIHGSNDPKSIGTEASSGCIRMHNGHAVHLATMVRVGTLVKVF